MLHMTGSAVSQQLRRIETEAGAKIVEPDGRGLRFTAKGKLLAECARKVADVMQEAENDLHSDETFVDELRIAAIASIIRSLLGARLSEFWRTYPRVQVTVEDGETADHLDRLLAGIVDLVLAESWSASPLRIPAGVVTQQVAREELFIALSTDHPLARSRRLSVGDLADERWATCAQGSDAHAALEQVARQSGAELRVAFYVADHVTQLALVREGLAIACLPRIVDQDDDHTVRYIQLEAPLHRDILLLSSKKTRSLALQALVDQLAQ